MAATRNRPPGNLAAGVADFLDARLHPADTVCVGFSGGCDSVVLLNVVAGLGLGPRLRAIHVHHGLSPVADGWADFCASCCTRLGVPLAVERIAVDGVCGQGIEAAARAARYAAFARDGADVVLLGHHGDDQAETLLFNLLRGSGVAGAAAMREERRHGAQRILRPLLGWPRAEVEAHARARGLAWVDDESNADTAFARNFLRHEVMPLLSARFPAAGANLGRAAAHFAETAGLLDDLAALDWAAVSAGDALRLPALRGLSPARLANLLRYRLRQLGWQVPAAARLAEFCRQLQAAGPDRHPELALPQGRMVAGNRLLRWEVAG